MSNPKGFLEIERKPTKYRPVRERIKDWKEVSVKPDDKDVSEQAGRCMQCGVPFCHFSCPLGNLIPEWNSLVYENKWKEAYERLSLTNNFPEFTGLLCPALCEPSCVLGISQKPVTIKQIELAIIDKAFKEGWVKPVKPFKRTGKKVAVIGSGPAGLSAASRLNRYGHRVTIFEQDKKIGGLLRYGIPGFKMEQWRLDRRIKLLEQEEILFKPNSKAGTDISMEELEKKFDAVILATGASRPRDLEISGRNLEGIYFAMEYLKGDKSITANNKNVIVIGGGDTGSDCMGTALRQKAGSVTQLQYHPALPEKRSRDNPWPLWPKVFTVSSSQEEGGKMEFSVVTNSFSGRNGKVTGICVAKGMEEKEGKGKRKVVPVPGSDYEIPADLVLLAMGFTGPDTSGLISELGLELTPRGTIQTDDHKMTNKKGIFAAGDASRGQSLIVYAIAEGRQTAKYVDEFLQKK